MSDPSFNQTVGNRCFAAHVRHTLGDWMDSVASSSPAPGGGTVSAVAGAMAAGLAAMVARLTVGRKKYAEVDGEFRQVIERVEALRVRLMRLGDAAAFNAVSAAYALPKEPAPPTTSGSTSPGCRIRRRRRP